MKARKPEPTEEMLTWRTVRKRIGDLVDWKKNPRRLTEKQAKDLEQSLKKFGYVEEIVVNADGRSIIGGHMRRKVALAAILKPDAMVDVRMPSRELTDREAEELAIRLNRNTGEWDFDALANGFDVSDLLDWGFEAKNFDMPAPPSEGTDQSEELKTGFDVIVSLKSEKEQDRLLKELIDRGFACRAVVF